MQRDVSEEWSQLYKTPSSSENQSPAQTTTSPIKPKVSERFELNDLENKSKAAKVVNAKLRQTNNSLEEQNKGLSSDLEKKNNKFNIFKKQIDELNNKYSQNANELSQAKKILIDFRNRVTSVRKIRHFWHLIWPGKLFDHLFFF